MPHQPAPHDVVRILATGAVATRCLQVVAELGVADHIDAQPVAVADLASSCRVDPDALDRVLRLLAAYGIFNRRHGSYSHTPSSRLLRSDHPKTMRPYAQMTGLPVVWGSLTELRHAVETGRPAIEVFEPRGAWAYLEDRPVEAEIFGRAMTSKAGADVGAILATYDFTRFRRIADIGGGRGHQLRAIINVTPGAAGVLFDLPVVIDTLNAEDQPRIILRAGDFFADPLPSADAYILMEVLHDWPDEQCVAILSAIRRAAPDGATLLIAEDLIPEEHAGPGESTLDVIMLAVAGGRERSVDQMGELLVSAGFRLTGVIDTPSPIHLVEARPA